MGGRLQVVTLPSVLTLRDNWIFNVGLLRRLDEKRLHRLNLPLLLEEELARIIQMKGGDCIQLFSYVIGLSAFLTSTRRTLLLSQTSVSA